jgi:hypothetical protein
MMQSIPLIVEISTDTYCYVHQFIYYNLFIDEISIYALNILAASFNHVWSSSSIKILKMSTYIIRLHTTMDLLILVPSYTTLSQDTLY